MDLDLSEVLAQSRATTARLEASVTKGGADSIPRLERPLPQIDRESRKLAPSAPADASAALRLLSAHGVNTQRLSRGLPADTLLDVPAPRIAAAHLDAHLARDHEAAVIGAISTSLARAHALSATTVADSRDSDWASAKRALVAAPTLIPRSRIPVEGSKAPTAPGGVLASPFRSARASSRPLIPSSGGGRFGLTGSGALNASQGLNGPAPASCFDGVVRQSIHARATSTPTAVATELDDALVEARAPRGDIAGAPKAVQHLHAVFTSIRYMAGEASTNSAPPAEGAMGGMFSAEDRRKAILGAIRYLALQFREDKMRRELAARPRDAARGGIPGLVGDVRAYLNLSFDRGVPTQLSAGPCVAGLPLWPQVYFCLRAGDPRAAMDVVSEALKSSATVSSSVLLFNECLRAYAESETRRSIPEDLLIRLVHDYGMSVHRGLDTYQRVCYVVLARLDPAAGEKMALLDEDYALLFFSIEDYLWLRLSVARLDGDASPPGALAVYELSLPAIQAEILQFGPAHFDERGDSPVFYALILLLCGQFAAAIEYLESGARAVTEAVHIAFVLHHYGMIRSPSGSVPDETGRRGLTPASATPSGGATPSGDGSDNESRCLTVNYEELLWGYIRTFSVDDPALAAVYLFTIRDANRRNAYLEKLVLESRAFELLLGDGPITTPSRRRGVLEELWPLGGSDARQVGTDWSSMVSAAACTAERLGDRSAAATLHDLTGATEKVAQIVTDKLSAELTSRTSPARALALADARAYQQRLSTRAGAARADGPTLRSLDAVVQLAEFFDAAWQADSTRAWTLVRGVGVLPTSDAEVTAKVREASVAAGRWTHAVTDRIPDAVVAAMEVLAQLHAARRDAADAAPLRAAARVLVDFAGLLPHASADVSARLIRLEVLMS